MDNMWRYRPGMSHFKNNQVQRWVRPFQDISYCYYEAYSSNKRGKPPVCPLMCTCWFSVGSFMVFEVEFKLVSLPGCVPLPQGNGTTQINTHPHASHHSAIIFSKYALRTYFYTWHSQPSTVYVNLICMPSSLFCPRQNQTPAVFTENEPHTWSQRL